MKRIIIIFLGILTSTSCADKTAAEESQNDKFQTTQQVWKLVTMTGSIAGASPTSGAEMQWQERIELNSDQTFTKIREINGQVLQKSGTYAFITLEDGEYLEMTYPSSNSLIGNCTSDTKETFRLENANKLIGTWIACDGPGLFYDKVVQ